MFTHSFAVEKLAVKVFPSRSDIGKAAAASVASITKDVLKTNSTAAIVFAAAPSQNEFLEEFVTLSLPWERIIAFHMDEYIGLPVEHPQRFRKYLNDHLFSKVTFHKVHLLSPSDEDPQRECERYSALLARQPIDVVCMGIGENGHIAFNDPPVADFNDPKSVKIVELDQSCRQQQVNDGCFPTINDVPPTAMTLTVPALMSGAHLSIVVPGPLKAEAVKRTLIDPMTTACPSTILRTHASAILYIDHRSAERIPTEKMK